MDLIKPYLAKAIAESRIPSLHDFISTNFASVVSEIYPTTATWKSIKQYWTMHFKEACVEMKVSK